MGLQVGDRLPEAVFLEFTGVQPVEVPSAEAFAGRVAAFAMPGAFTRTCDGAHMPSVVRNADPLWAEGVDRIVVIAVNDPFVMAAWGRSSGARDKGIRMLADPAGAFTRAVGMEFDAASVGFFGRSRRYGMLVEHGAVAALGIEESRSECTTSGGEALLDAVRSSGSGRCKPGASSAGKTWALAKPGGSAPGTAEPGIQPPEWWALHKQVIGSE